MRVSQTFLTAAIGFSLVHAHNGVPPCTIPCLEEFTPKAGCSFDDVTCQCQPGFLDTLQPLVSQCLVQSCTSDEIEMSLQAAAVMCASASASATDAAPTASETAADDAEGAGVRGAARPGMGLWALLVGLMAAW